MLFYAFCFIIIFYSSLLPICHFYHNNLFPYYCYIQHWDFSSYLYELYWPLLDAEWSYSKTPEATRILAMKTIVCACQITFRSVLEIKNVVQTSKYRALRNTGGLGRPVAFFDPLGLLRNKRQPTLIFAI